MGKESLLNKTAVHTKKGVSFDLERYQPLPVVYQIRGAILHRIKAGLPILTEIDGREETKSDVIRALLSGAHPYLISEEGTGKTRMAKSLTGLLTDIPFIMGCPYHDDPKWAHEMLCPRCRVSKDPAKEFGIDFLPARRRFSRIQGNEYTNEAKLLGLKDIQAIASGKSPSDPSVFTGTGVFRANRGVLFVDELPAIRTKVQVLFHPILEEGKAILEEYNWEHPLDLVFIATGNPIGFSHVNEIPRPLLDRLEPIYMDLPDEDIEREIIQKETFRVKTGGDRPIETGESVYWNLEDIVRKVAAPWWIMDIVNKAVRYSRICPFVEKKASIRATNRALEHTYASVEMENRMVANLRHVYTGLRLALRARVGLRADLVDFDNPSKTFKIGSELARDFIWNAIEEMRHESGLLGDCSRQELGSELNAMLSSGELNLATGRVPWAIISKYPELTNAMQWMRRAAWDKTKQALANETERKLYENDRGEVADERNYSALEVLINICLHDGTLHEFKVDSVFIPNRFRG